MLSAFNYKNMWEGFYKEYGKRFLIREYYKNGICKPYIPIKDLMDDFKEKYLKELDEYNKYIKTFKAGYGEKPVERC